MTLKRFLILLIANLFSIFISLSIIILMILFLANCADYAYNATHAIPDPVDRGDDLGLGFAVVGTVVIASICSVPIFYVLFKIINKIIKNIIGDKI